MTQAPTAGAPTTLPGTLGTQPVPSAPRLHEYDHRLTARVCVFAAKREAAHSLEWNHPGAPAARGRKIGHHASRGHTQFLVRWTTMPSPSRLSVFASAGPCPDAKRPANSSSEIYPTGQPEKRMRADPKPHAPNLSTAATAQFREPNQPASHAVCPPGFASANFLGRRPESDSASPRGTRRG
jgi:hypothetical protein